MEGTVLRVPCIPSERGGRRKVWASHHRRLGFWQSSVRGPGPPASDNRRTDPRLPRCRARPEQPGVTLSQSGNPFALRVTRMHARTRCRRPTAQRTAGVRVAASPPAGDTARLPSPIRVSVSIVEPIPIDGTRTGRDVSTTSWDDLGRLEASHSSPRISCGSLAVCSIQAKQTSRAGTFQRRFGTFRNVPNVPSRPIVTRL